jgi:site-specific DNA recombinase
MNPSQIALIALRVSTPEQLKNFSIETQRQRCLAYAEQHHYAVPTDGIAIDDETGATLYRDDFGMILHRLRGGEAKHLIVFVLDRLTREPADFLPLRKELHALGVTIHVAREDRALSKDPLDDLPDDIRVVIAKHERAVFRERSMRGRLAKIASGRVPGNGPAPYGFSFIGFKRDRQLVINEEEAAIARMMAHWFLFGENDQPPYGVVDIARRLTELRIPSRSDTLGRTKQLRGRGEWGPQTVANILRDSSLGGIFYANRIERLSKTQSRLRPRDEWLAIPIPAILDADLFAAVQRKFDTGRAMATRNNTQRRYLLRCRIRCSCGYAVCGYGRPNNPNSYYRCISHVRGRKYCELPYIRCDLIEPRVWHWIEHEALADAQIQAHIERAQAHNEPHGHDQAERTKLEAQLAANAAAEQQLLAEAIRGRFSAAAIDAELQRLAAEKQLLQQRLDLLTRPLVAPTLSGSAAFAFRTYAAIIREGLTDMSPDEQRRAIDMLDTRLLLSIEDGSVIAEATCILRLDNARLLIDTLPRTSSFDNYTLTIRERLLIMPVRAGGAA